MKTAVKVLLLVCAVLLVAAACAFFYLRNTVYYPEAIVSGENTCRLGRFDVSKDGLTPLQEIIDRTGGLSESLNVSFFEAQIDREGCVTGFALVLEVFDEDGSYLNIARYDYEGETLTYAPPGSPQKTNLAIKENPNCALGYLSEQAKKIPLKEQLEESFLESAVLEYQPNTLINAGKPIFDGRANVPFAVLAPSEYGYGIGGTSDGKTNVVFSLVGTMPDGGEVEYDYVFAPADSALAVGNPVYYMESDYYISNGRLTLLRNHGQESVETDITAEELDETLEFYRYDSYLPVSSFFISSDESLPIAYFYGGGPKLKLSSDNGASWTTVDFPGADYFGRAVTRRVVGFVTPEFGYAALGTDWSMGGGEGKRCYLTYDGGKTWTEKELPSPLSSETLLDIAMADEMEGVLALSDGIDGSLPVMYVTEDAGETWVPVELPYNELPLSADYFNSIDRLTISSGSLELILGQGNEGTTKAIFVSDANSGEWSFLGTREETIHNIG